MLAFALIVSLPFTASEADCTSASQCNRLGTQALNDGDFARATSLFERQIDFADTAFRDAEGTADAARLESARDIALNNAGLTALRAGDCLMARAWLDIADSQHTATQANRRQLDARCPGPAPNFERTGEFRQYVGHGAWNTVSIRPTGDETLLLDAFWMRVGRGPLSEYGPAAFGTLDEIALRVDGGGAKGVFHGNDPTVGCELTVTYGMRTIDVQVTDRPDCQIGGASAWLGGRFLRTGEPAAELDDDQGAHGDD